MTIDTSGWPWADKDGTPIRQSGGWPTEATKCWLTMWSDTSFSEGPTAILWERGSDGSVNAARRIQLSGGKISPPPDELPFDHPFVFHKRYPFPLYGDNWFFVDACPDDFGSRQEGGVGDG